MGGLTRRNIKCLEASSVLEEGIFNVLASSQLTGHGVYAVLHQKIADMCDFVIRNIEQERRGSRYLSLAEAGPARSFQHVMYHVTPHMMHHMTQLARSDPIP